MMAMARVFQMDVNDDYNKSNSGACYTKYFSNAGYINIFQVHVTVKVSGSVVQMLVTVRVFQVHIT